MATTLRLTETALERDTFAIDVSFYDIDQTTAVTPNSGLTWTLTDTAGNVINSRSAVSIASASTVHIVLTDADLAITADNGLQRIVTLTGTYNSVTYGNNLKINRPIYFSIEENTITVS